MIPTRRLLLTGLAAALALPVRAEEALEIDWADLVPASDRALTRLGVIGHAEAFLTPETEQPHAMTDAYDDKLVSLPGFAIPLDYDGLGSTVMILAPFIGACIHVPPPPPNQLVLVEAAEPYPIEDLFEPIRATGRFGRFQADVELAEIGYRMQAAQIEKLPE